jgi:hypothetical protein
MMNFYLLAMTMAMLLLTLWPELSITKFTLFVFYVTHYFRLGKPLGSYEESPTGSMARREVRASLPCLDASRNELRTP